jgi:AP2-associated kinase
MMYRPPEMFDKYMRWNVTTKVDIWMLGCVAYTLCYALHPFQEAQKLAIINANYQFPADKPCSEKMQDFIRLCLIPNPQDRPNICNLLAILDNWSALPSINLPQAALVIKQKQAQQRL